MKKEEVSYNDFLELCILTILLSVILGGLVIVSFQAVAFCDTSDGYEWNHWFGYCEKVEPSCYMDWEGTVTIDINYSGTPVRDIELNSIYGKVPCTIKVRIYELISDGVI